ncbi:MAG: type II toxin-antitoxin system VapC family toxin [Pseudomonadota bacterium]
MRYVIGLDVTLRLLRDRTSVPPGNKLVAPTLLRSEVLSHLFMSVRRGEFDRAEAAARLDHMRTLKIRLLGDRVLQKVAWDVAEQLGWADTLKAEYVALTKLQADAFVTLDEAFARSLQDIVPLAAIEDVVTSSGLVAEASAPN